MGWRLSRIVLASVKRASATLHKLIIRDRYLNKTEMLTIINALRKCKGLRYLRVNVLELDIDVLDLMAAHLPSLQGLSLSVKTTAKVTCSVCAFLNPDAFDVADYHFDF